MPRVTVVMITRDRRESAVRSVDVLRRSPDAPPVIVVDNGSTDGTAEALTGRAGVTVLPLDHNLGSAARTLGVRAARTEYVAFSDDDSWWAPGALTRAANVLDAHPRLAVLVGRTLVGPDERDDPINAKLAAAPLGTEPDLPGPTALGFLACAAVVRRDDFLAAGGFHPRFGVGGEEQLLALDLLAAGRGLAYVPGVIAHHHPAPGPERAGRRVREERNRLWTVWLRRRRRSVVAVTRAVLRDAVRDPVARRVLVQGLGGLGWVLRERRPVPEEVEATARRLDVAPGLSVRAPG